MKNLIVVGGGIAGITLLKELEKVSEMGIKITLIEPKDYLEVPYGMLRALVDPLGYGTKVRRRISEIITSKHIEAKVIKMTSTEITLDNGEAIQYDFAVIATGSAQKGFQELKIRDRHDIINREEQWKAHAKRLEDAEKIAILGGGTVGVELAGEIGEKYPEKKVVIYHRGSRMLESLPHNASAKAARIMSKLGVSIRYNQDVKIEEADGSFTIEDSDSVISEFDIVYKSFGNDIETDYLDYGLKHWINRKGQIEVNEYLQPNGQNNIWVVGDINDVPEIKHGTLAIRQAKIASGNILRMLDGKLMRKYKPIKGAISFVTLGKRSGIAQLPFGRLDFLAAYKQKKDLFVTDILYK